jgi:hypothetical protein
MRRVGFALVVLLAAIPLAQSAAQRAVIRKQVWFTPASAAPDLLDLFNNGALWETARERLAVIKFYQGQLMVPHPLAVEGNTLDALRDVRAFSRISSEWHKSIAIEVGSVKAFYCSADGTAESRAVSETNGVIGVVEALGGRVSYLAMDEPFYAAATERPCGAPDAEAAVDRVVNYVRGVTAVHPGISIGLIEPWPYFSAATIARFLTALRQRGVTLPFFHVDVDLDQVRPGRDDFARDLRYLAGVCAAQGTRFGMIIWGQDGTSDAAYMTGAWKRVQLTADAFADWLDMPQDIVFQTWTRDPRTNLPTVPANLPEATPNTHTWLINQATPLLHGPQHYPAPRK